MKLLSVVAGALAFNAFEASARSAANPALQFKERSLPSTPDSKHLRYEHVKRTYTPDPNALGSPDTDEPGYAQSDFNKGQPYSASSGKGAPFSGGTNTQVDLENPSNLGQESTDSGSVTNLKWRFSDSKTRLLKGGWVRQQVITDLPASKDIAGAQQHLTKGAIRELHWHRVAEWGFVYSGRVGISAVDEDGKNQWTILGVGDVWYFPKGAAHTIQGLDDQNEYLLAFDDGNFDTAGVTFMVDDWIAHTPKSILAKNFGVNESIFATVPSPNPYIAASTNGQTAENVTVEHPYGELVGNSSYTIRNSDVPVIEAPGGGGTIQIFDSRSFPISTTIAAALITVKPGAMRELHWHPTAAEWDYVLQGQGRATVFIGSAAARTFDLSAGDTAVWPDNAGHYVINTSNDTDLVWLEIFKADRIADISLTQWLALTPSPVVAQVLNISESAVKNLKKEKQLIVS